MDKAYFKDYYHLERNHWWFRARLAILEDRIQKLTEGNTGVSILNAGVATGATSQMLENFGDVTSLEYDEECCSFLRSELGMEVTHGSLTELPYANETFDLVCAFDVIEHIEDDGAALTEIKRVLKKDGSYCITVPAYQFLWSEHDEINHHFRRYTKKELLSKLDRADLPSTYSSYFNFWLFGPIAGIRSLSRLLPAKKGSSKPISDFERLKNRSLSDRLFRSIFQSEKALLSKGIRFPFGISILAEGNRR